MKDYSFGSNENIASDKELSDRIDIGKFHRKLNEFTWQCGMVNKTFKLRYPWRVMQAVNASGIAYKNKK